MRKTGFAIEMVLYTIVLTIFVLSKADWIPFEKLKLISDDPVVSEQQQEEKKLKAESDQEEKQVEEPVETEAPTPDPDSPEGRAAAVGLPAPPAIDINSWEYILVNSESTIDETFAPEIGVCVSQTSESNQDVRIVDALNKFAADAEAQGLEVYLSSGYRSYETQQVLFDMKLEEYDYETAATIVAIPGTSEHQTGLCCDITDIYRSPKNSELENTDTYKWMSAHCAEYGFIVRFPKGKEDITKIIYEPWHFRYVGVDAAKYIMENDLTLEEFVKLYKA